VISNLSLYGDNTLHIPLHNAPCGIYQLILVTNTTNKEVGKLVKGRKKLEDRSLNTEAPPKRSKIFWVVKVEKNSEVRSQNFNPFN